MRRLLAHETPIRNTKATVITVQQTLLVSLLLALLHASLTGGARLHPLKQWGDNGTSQHEPPPHDSSPTRAAGAGANQLRSRLAYVLLASGLRNSQLASILHQLRTRVLPWTQGDVLLFHTGEYETDEQKRMLLEAMPDMQFVLVPAEAWKLPDGLQEEDATNWIAFSNPKHSLPKGIGYRHMCRWYSNGMFHFLHNWGYQWVLRLDEDSEVLSDVRVDIVTWMEQHNKQYGFRLFDSDNKFVTQSLPELTAWYISANNIQPEWLYDYCHPKGISGLTSAGWDRTIIYNNMFIANITWWLQPKVQSYLTWVERTNGHYLFRWGDAPVHTMVLGMFLPRIQLHRFGFAYCHNGPCDAASDTQHLLPALRDSLP